MSKKNNREKELNDFRKSLDAVDEKAFDGHTDFYKLTAREKLEWLSELIYFKYLASKRKDPK